jgi:hypothetical protein
MALVLFWASIADGSDSTKHNPLRFHRLVRPTAARSACERKSAIFACAYTAAPAAHVNELAITALDIQTVLSERILVYSLSCARIRFALPRPLGMGMRELLQLVLALGIKYENRVREKSEPEIYTQTTTKPQDYCKSETLRANLISFLIGYN